MPTTSSFAVRQIILQGWPVLSVLFLCSIISLAVAWERWTTYRKASKAIPKTVNHISSKMSEVRGHEEKERIAQNEIARWMDPLEKRLSILGTIASIAPFIGLLGTVLGIIRAFRAVSITMGGGPSVVATGIAEA